MIFEVHAPMGKNYNSKLKMIGDENFRPVDLTNVAIAENAFEIQHAGKLNAAIIYGIDSITYKDERKVQENIGSSEEFIFPNEDVFI